MDAEAELTALVERLEADRDALPGARARGDALAETVGGDAGLRWHLAVVRAVMAGPPDGDEVRELYGALVDRYRTEPAHLESLRALGAEIRALESQGALPSTLVARSDRRRH